MFIGFGASCLIEGVQLFSWRSTDIDDVLLNTAGTLLGWLCYMLVLWVAPRMKEALRRPSPARLRTNP